MGMDYVPCPTAWTLQEAREPGSGYRSSDSGVHRAAIQSIISVDDPPASNGRSSKKAKLDASYSHDDPSISSASSTRRILPTLPSESTGIPRFFATVLHTTCPPDAGCNGVSSPSGSYSREPAPTVQPAAASSACPGPVANYVHGSTDTASNTSTAVVRSARPAPPLAFPLPREAAAYTSSPPYYSSPTSSHGGQTVQPLYNSTPSYYSAAAVGHHGEGESSWTSFLGDVGSEAFENHASQSLARTPPAALQNLVHPVDYEPNLAAAAAAMNPTHGVHGTTLSTTPPYRPIPGNQVRIHTGDIVHRVLPDAQQLVQTKGQRRGRSSFSAEKREETSKTRSIGACLRCKSQRIRCVPSPEGPEHACTTCQQVSLNSKKVLHDIHCVRWRLSEMRLFRFGGLDLTHRWPDTVIKDILACSNNSVHEIEIKIFYSSVIHKYDLCPVPVKLLVHRFEPNQDDVLIRKWTKHHVNEQGETVYERAYVELPPYSLVNVTETTETLRTYFQQNVMYAMVHVARSSRPEIKSHMEALIKHYYSLPNGDVEKAFLERFFIFWFCIRFTTGSAYISGPDKLGCLPVEDEDYPLGHRISIPRMITAQCDAIMVTKFLRPMSSEVLNEFERFFHIGNPDNWFMLYACTFMLLHEIAFSSQDRRRHAVENWITDDRYSVSDFVMDLQFGANIILCYWHYYRTMDPSNEGWDIFCQIIKPNPRPRENIESAKGKGKKKVHVTQDQCDLLMTHWAPMIDIARRTKTSELSRQYEHPLYFVSQMYVKGWKTLETYKKKKGS